MTKQNSPIRDRSTNLVSIADNGEFVTTSLVIAEGADVAHKNIIQQCRKYSADLERFGAVEFKILPFETNGGIQTRQVAFLNQEQATLILTFMRNTPAVIEFKVRLVDAFFQLARHAIPQDYGAALRLAADQADQIVALRGQISNQAPKVAFHDAVTASEDVISVLEAAKVLDTGQNRLMSYLRRIGWISKRNEPYQSTITSGYMDVKLGEYEHPEHGLKKSITPMITGKGLAKLREKLAEDSLLEMSA